MIEGAGIVARDARHVGRLGEEHRARLEDVRGKERDQPSNLAGDRILGGWRGFRIRRREEQYLASPQQELIRRDTSRPLLKM